MASNWPLECVINDTQNEYFVILIFVVLHGYKNILAMKKFQFTIRLSWQLVFIKNNGKSMQSLANRSTHTGLYIIVKYETDKPNCFSSNQNTPVVILNRKKFPRQCSVVGH